jgi:hypothetical protein
MARKEWDPHLQVLYIRVQDVTRRNLLVQDKGKLPPKLNSSTWMFWKTHNMKQGNRICTIVYQCTPILFRTVPDGACMSRPRLGWHERTHLLLPAILPMSKNERKMTYQQKIRTYHFPYTSKWQDLVSPLFFST